MQDWHSLLNNVSHGSVYDRDSIVHSDRRSCFQRNWVDSVVGADDEGDIRIFEVIVNLIHLQHDCNRISQDQRP